MSLLQSTQTSMKFTVSRKDFAEALSLASDACSVRSSMPIYTTLLIQAGDSGLSLIGCDGEMWAKATCLANVSEPGAVCVPSKLLSEIIGALGDGEITIELSGTSVVLTHGMSEWKMLALQPDDFPPIPAVEESSSLTLNPKELLKGIESVIFAVSDDTHRQALTGVLFHYDGNALTLVATDTHRMSIHTIYQEGIGADLHVVVPGKALKIIKSLNFGDEEKVKVTFDETRIMVDTGSSVVVSQLLNGPYPNWERVVPTEHTRTWVIDRVDLVENVKRAMILARDNANRVRFSGSGDKMVISAKTEDKGEAREELSIVNKNGDLEMAFNGRYLLDALQSMESDGVQAEITESSRATILRPTDENEATICILMPMAIS